MKAFLNWSGGKDSGFCLYKAREQGINIQALVTSINQYHDRVSMHGVRRSLLELQAASIKLPLYTIELPEQPDMDLYEQKISETNALLKKKGFTSVVSGDLFLEDLKTYREKLYAKDGLDCLFPLWKIDTRQMLKEFIAEGFKAVIVCVNNSFLDQSFCGRLIDDAFINDLPANVDPCGENGEYHSFVFDGPIFTQPIAYQAGEIVFKEYKSPSSQPQSFGFFFQDLLPS